MSLTSLVELKTFNLFPEYFVGISVLYIIIVMVFISYNVYGLIVQKSISECIGLILLLACYLIINEDLVLSSNVFGFYSLSGFYKSIIMDYFGFFTKFIVCFFASLYFFVIADYLKDSNLTSFEYLIILLFAVLGLMLLCTSNDLLTAYLSIELISLSSYVLAAFRKTSSYSVEAGIKYLVTGAISSAFFLLGSSFMYAYVGSINVTDFWSIFSDETFLKWDNYYWQEYYINWYNSDPYFDPIFFANLTWHQWITVLCLIKISKFTTFLNSNGLQLIAEYFQVSEPFLEIGLTFIVFSLFIKLALAPFHLWSLDVYEGSPTISTFFFAVITKLSFFVFLTRICYMTAIRYQEFWQFYSVIISFLSIFIGSFGGLRQRKLKTLLAYSSISHMGYALLSFSVGTRFGMEMLLFYIIIYIISGLSVWFVILALRVKKMQYQTKLNKELGDLVMLRKSNPALALSLALTMFSIAGIPPLIGFFAKMGIFLSILHLEYYVIAILSVLCSVVSTFYYIRIIKLLYFENLLVGKLYLPISSGKVILLSFSIFVLIFLFINPTFLYLIVYNIIWCSFFDDAYLLYI